MLSESKKEIYDLIPQQFYPKTALIDYNTPFEKVLTIAAQSGFEFPLIVKPDIGRRGFGVKIVQNENDLNAYHQKAAFDYLVQDLIPYHNEVGIFYVRFPGDKKGKITGIVRKEFVIIEGDGHSTLRHLIHSNPRYALQIRQIKKEFGHQFDEIPEKGKKINLVPFGNHARGAKFIDDSHLISQQLIDTIDSVCQEIPEFYFGRLDIMYQSWADLEAGNHFAIVEVNGAGSEPTHIYDPKNTLFFAWCELARHFSMMYNICSLNHKRGVSYLSFREGMEQIRIFQAQNKKLNFATKN